MYHAVIVAAGTGDRMDSLVPKQYLPVLGKPVLAHTIGVFQRATFIQRIVVVINPHHLNIFRETIVSGSDAGTKILWVYGGDTRQESVLAGVAALEKYSEEYVLIHDGVRMLVNQDILKRCAAAAREHEAACCAIPCVDTLKITTNGKKIDHSVDRNRVWRAQTPQAFRVSLILGALRRAEEEGFQGTDDASLVERIGHPVVLVPGSEDNFKITTPRDFIRAEERVRWMNS